MKLLLDHNLAAALVERLADLYPGSSHTGRLGLARSSDEEVWRYARDHQMILVSKDSDFNQMSLLRGAPPKLIWIRAGNCRTQYVEALLRREHPTVVGFVANEMDSVLALV